MSEDDLRAKLTEALGENVILTQADARRGLLYRVAPADTPTTAHTPRKEPPS